MKKENIVTLIICLAIVYAVALAGSFFTSKSVKTDWFESIRPSITPPSYVFPIVWNILFFLIALSLYFAWTNSKKRQKLPIAAAFCINFALNISWSFFYFYLKSPLLAFINIIALIISIAFMIIVAKKASKTSAYLLIPYLLWVCFASVLNFLSV